MEEITYALYSISADSILKWGSEDSGKTLRNAYDTAMIYCNTKDDPEAKKEDLKIIAMQNGTPVYDCTLYDAFKTIRKVEIADAAKVERQKELEEKPPSVLPATEAESPPSVPAVVAERGIDEVLPNTSIAPWRISMHPYNDAYGINDSEGKLIALAVNNTDTEGHAETNTRLIEMAPELSQLATNMLQAVLAKDENNRTNDENNFMSGMLALYGEVAMQVDVDVLDYESRQVLLTFAEKVITLHDNVNMLKKHGSLTPEIIDDLNTSLDEVSDNLVKVRMRLL